MLIKNKNFARVTVIFFTLLIIAGSSIPSHRIPKAFELTPDKLIHCAEYFVFGFFLFNWVLLEFDKRTLSANNLLALILGSTMGIIDENYQRLTPGRNTNVWDWVLDTVGVILAITLTNYLIKKNVLKLK